MSKKKHDSHADGGGELPVQHEAASDGPSGEELKERFLAAKDEYDEATAAIAAAATKLGDVEHEIDKRLAAKGRSVEITLGEHRYTAAKRKERDAEGNDRYTLRRVHDRTAVDL